MLRLRGIPILIGVLAVLVLLSGCGGAKRVLYVKSDPADAEVCIKGRLNSEFFPNEKTCVGTTPFEADRITINVAGGEKKTVDFREVEESRENFYLIVSRPGYASQSVQVPGWEHFIALKSESGAGAIPPPAAPSAGIAAAVAPANTSAEKGTIRINSEPLG